MLMLTSGWRIKYKWILWTEDLARQELTLFASRNSNAAYDPADIGLTAIPKFERYTLNPQLFLFFNDQTQS